MHKLLPYQIAYGIVSLKLHRPKEGLSSRRIAESFLSIMEEFTSALYPGGPPRIPGACPPARNLPPVSKAMQVLQPAYAPRPAKVALRGGQALAYDKPTAGACGFLTFFLAAMPVCMITGRRLWIWIARRFYIHLSLGLQLIFPSSYITFSKRRGLGSVFCPCSSRRIIFQIWRLPSTLFNLLTQPPHGIRGLECMHHPERIIPDLRG